MQLYSIFGDIYDADEFIHIECCDAKELVVCFELLGAQRCLFLSADSILFLYPCGRDILLYYEHSALCIIEPAVGDLFVHIYILIPDVVGYDK